MIKVEGVGKFLDKLEKWEKEIEILSQGVTRGLVAETFNYIVETSAQFTGDFAANWNLSVGSPDYTFIPNKFFVNDRYVTSTRIAGHPEAVNDAKSRAQTVIDTVRLGQPVYITNTANREGDYAWKIENGVINFREGNEGHTVGRALDRLRSKPFITRGNALRLQDVTI